MDIAIPIFFGFLAFIFFFLALMEEREPVGSNEDEEKSDLLVITLLIVTSICMWIMGITFMFVTETYYDVSLSAYVETVPNSNLQPLGWIGIILGLFTTFLTANKTLVYFDNKVLE